MRSILVTGAGRGIGLELALAWAAGGARVIATTRGPAPKALLDAGARVEELDVTDDESVARLGRRLADTTIDVLVNNAAVGGGYRDLGSIDCRALLAFFDVNAVGPLRVTQALLPSLRRSHTKLVVHVSSHAASIGLRTDGGRYTYRSSKAALNMIGRLLAFDLAGEGFCNVLVDPGWARTEIGGAAAPSSAAEVASELIALIERIDPARDNGRFIDTRGQSLPW